MAPADAYERDDPQGVDPNWVSQEEIEKQVFRHRLAVFLAMHHQCEHVACQRNRTCARPAGTPCYWKNLPVLREVVFPVLREHFLRKNPP